MPVRLPVRSVVLVLLAAACGAAGVLAAGAARGQSLGRRGGWAPALSHDRAW
mgnify:CR=1 FL=1